MYRETYYKCQQYDQSVLSWKDIQRAHDSYEAADAARPPGVRSRIIAVTTRGRGPVPGSERTA